MPNDAQPRIERWLRRSQASHGLLQPRGESFALGSQLGLIRSENQDRVIVAKFTERGKMNSAPIKIGVLCDGIGGMQDGGRCADLAISAFISHVISSNTPLSTKTLTIAAHKANDAVYRQFRGQGGTTLVAAAIKGPSIFGVNIGDSRAYLIKHEQSALQLSIDDTLAGQLEALGEPREGTRNELVQFIGMGAELEPHEFQLGIADNQKGILLTSDGADSVPEPVFSTILATAARPRDIVERLLLISLWMGGRDNATAVAMKLTEPDGRNDFSASSDTLEMYTPSSCLEMILPASLEFTQEEKPQSLSSRLRSKARPSSVPNENHQNMRSSNKERPNSSHQNKTPPTDKIRAPRSEPSVVIIQPDNTTGELSIAGDESRHHSPGEAAKKPENNPDKTRKTKTDQQEHRDIPTKKEEEDSAISTASTEQEKQNS